MVSLVDTAVRQDIQSIYRRWLESCGFKPRYGQKAMIGILANHFFSIERDDAGLRKTDDESSHLCLVEAGTGTGKTIAYAIAAILSARALDKKVVISTATVALQEQLIHRDLPALREHSGLEFDFAIAKGRSRYFCLARAERHLADAGQREQAGVLFPDEEPILGAHTLEQLNAILQAFTNGDWQGDVDTLERMPAPETWSLVAAERSSCSGKRCPHYKICPLFVARGDARDADVIVANHDLVLAELANGGGTLPDPEQVMYIFDEAHHLPGKAQSHFSAHMSLHGEQRRVLHLRRALQRLAKLPAANNGHDVSLASELAPLSKSIGQALDTVEELHKALPLPVEALFSSTNASSHGGDTIELRLHNGQVPAALAEIFSELATCYRLLDNELRKLQDLLLKQFMPAQDAAQLAREALFASIGDMQSRVQEAQEVSRSYAQADPPGQPPMARWIKQLSVDSGDFVFHAAPLATAEALSRLAWQPCFAAVMTSATLTALDSFDYFIRQVMVPSAGETALGIASNAFQIEGALNFAGSQFHVPAMRFDPTQVEGHTAEIVELLPELIAQSGGTLALFSSRRQMEAVHQALPQALRERCLVQGDRSKKLLLEQHCARVDEGRQSLLLGLASFAEGLDLPGAYCQQVIIAKLPFAVPDSPIDEAHSEWVESNGGNAFWDIAVPLASLRLKQACGRLLRHENDSGRVSLLDTRIVSKRYGERLLQSLPPFDRDIAGRRA